MADSQFPHYTTTFVGRDEEAQAIAELLRKPEQRLVSMIGPSGAGKTRLSLQVVDLIKDAFPDGCFWVALAPITEPDLVLPTIAKTLDIREISDVPLIETLATALRQRHILLVLDNIEQIRTAAPDLATLLQKTKHLTFLATSQIPLELELETCFSVAPLSMPTTHSFTSPQELLKYPAVALFVERIKEVQPTFQLDLYNAQAVVEICNRVLGLPLAIELVAAHSHHLTPENLLLLLRNYLPIRRANDKALTREELIKPVLNWCYRVLTPDQQRVLIRCGIFSGGWNRDAADQICNLPGNTIDIDAALAYLASRHLLLTEARPDGSVRYHMIDAIHDYASSQLRQRRRYDEVADLHSRWFAQLATLTDSGRADVLDTLADEHHNLRSALTYLIKQQNANQAVEMAGDLGLYWYMRGHWSEGFRLLKEIEVLISQAPTRAQAKALNWIAGAYSVRGDTYKAKEYFLQAMSRYEEINDLKGVMKIRNNLGIVARDHGNYDEAVEHMQTALDIVHELGDNQLATAIANNLGLAYRSQGSNDLAIATYQEYLPISQALGDEYHVALTMLNLGMVFDAIGRYEEAQPLLEQALQVYRKLEIQHYISDTLCVLAHTLFMKDQATQQAQALMNESIQIRSELQDFRGLVINLEILADFALTIQEPVTAIKLIGAAQQVRQRIGYHLSPHEEGIVSRVLADLQQACTADELEQGRKAGMALNDEQIFTLMVDLLARLGSFAS